MRKIWVAVAGTALCALAAAATAEHDHKLPKGPIYDRHELMERVGKNAKVIGNALKSGDLSPVASAAEKIAVDADKALALFPAGSTHPESRAKPEIWSNREEFEKRMKEFQGSAIDLVAAAKSGDRVAEAAQKMFDTCKSCHDSFRAPEKD